MAAGWRAELETTMDDQGPLQITFRTEVSIPKMPAAPKVVSGWVVVGPEPEAHVFQGTFNVDRCKTRETGWGVAALNKYKPDQVTIRAARLHVMPDGDVLDPDPHAIEKRRGAREAKKRRTKRAGR